MDTKIKKNFTRRQNRQTSLIHSVVDLEINNKYTKHDNTYTLFQQILEKYTKQEIASILGLHKGTISRWLEIEKVPKNYKEDFLRIMGLKNKEIYSIKERDQYYTKTEIAEKCFSKFKEIALDLGVDLNNYCFIEPSAGNGRFYNLLPEKRRIGIDIEPKGKGIIKYDYLKWKPEKEGKYIVIGNPPFGLRGHLALQFINHSFQFADIVAFILPQLFNSDGKGVAGKRVVGYKLAHNEYLPPNSFTYPDGTEIKINTVFQVWTKININKIKTKSKKTCDDFVSIFSLSDGGLPSNTRNKEMIGECDVYLPSTTFTGMKAYKSFYDLPNKRGYGVVIKKNKREIERVLFNTEWEKVAFLSTNSAVNLRISIIKDVVTKSGYFDKRLL